jgi:hypothetical protein
VYVMMKVSRGIWAMKFFITDCIKRFRERSVGTEYITKMEIRGRNHFNLDNIIEIWIPGTKYMLTV